MTEPTFERRLARDLGRYSEGGVRPIDAHAIALATVAPGGASLGGRLWDRWAGRVRVTPRLVLVTVLVVLAIAIAVTAVGLATRRPPQLTDRAQPTTQPISSTRPVASAPPEAPTAARIAYVQGGDIYVAAADASSPVKVLDDPGIDFTDVRWLSDGRHVVVGAVGLWTVVDMTTGERHRLDIPPGAETTWKPASDEVLASVGATLDQPAALLVIDALTGARRELPAGKRALGLAWSADGSRLGGVVGSDFVWIDPDTGSRTVVATTTSGIPEQVVWSMDLTRIAFVISPDIPCEMVTKTCPSASEVYAVEASADASAVPVKVAGPLPQGQLNGDNSTELFGPPPTPAWSPDGTWIAYRTATGLTLVHPDGTGERALPIGHVGTFTWDADGSGIGAIVTDAIDGTDGDEVHVDLATGATQASGLSGVSQVSPVSVGPSIEHAWDAAAEPSATNPGAGPTAAPSAPPIAPTSHRLLVRTWHDPCGDSAVEIDLDTGADQRIGTCGVKVASDGRHIVDDHAAIDLLTGTSVPLTGPHDVSPHGRWLITPPVLSDYSDQVAAADTPWEVATWDGTVRVRIPRPWVNPAYGPYYPSWSPDDSIVTVQQEHARIRVDLTTGEQVTLTGQQGIWATSSDGPIVYIRDGDAWIANADGSDAQNVSQFSFGGAEWVDLLPDGRTVAVLQGQLMWVIDLDGGRRSIDLGPVPDSFTREVTWSPDGRWFAATLGSDADGVLGDTRFYSIDGVLLADVEGNDLAWSPDGQHAAVSVNPWDIKPVHTTAPTRQPPGRLVLVDRSGRTTKVANAWGPVWSPDSTRLTVTSARKGGDKLDLLAADGTDRHTISTDHIGYVTWIPDR